MYISGDLKNMEKKHLLSDNDTHSDFKNSMGMVKINFFEEKLS